MIMEHITIKEIADELGVTSQAVRTRMKRKGIEPTMITSKGWVLDKRTAKAIIAVYGANKSMVERFRDNTVRSKSPTVRAVEGIQAELIGIRTQLEALTAVLEKQGK
jgi:predicted transcriptional regulator